MRRFARDQSGTTSIEYGLIVSLIFLAIITGVTAFGNKTTATMDKVSAAITGVMN